MWGCCCCCSWYEDSRVSKIEEFRADSLVKLSRRRCSRFDSLSSDGVSVVRLVQTEVDDAVLVEEGGGIKFKLVCDVTGRWDSAWWCCDEDVTAAGMDIGGGGGGDSSGT